MSPARPAPPEHAAPPGRALGADDVRAAVAAGLRDGRPVRLDLTDGGRVFVDHAVPVLAVWRGGAGEDETEGGAADEAQRATEEAHRLVTTQPAYVVSGPDGGAAEAVAEALSDALSGGSGGPASPLLVVDVWAPVQTAFGDDDPDPFGRRPGFTIYTGADGPDAATVEALCDALSGIELAAQGADVDHVATSGVAPPGLAPLRVGRGGALVGLAVDAVFHNAREGEFYPRVLDRVRAALAPALRGAVAEAAGVPAAALGRSELEPAAVAVDRGLSAVTGQYGLLLQVTPVNGDQAWEDFLGSGFERAPEFVYRPLTFDADAVRRDLFALPLDAVEDVTVQALLRECRDEAEAHVRMILDVGTPQFLPGSLRAYGAPDDGLVALARDVVAALDARPAPDAGGAGTEVVGATAFAAAARAELAYYRARSEHVPVEVEVRDDIPGSLMVSSGRLLVGSATQLEAERVGALLAHEVGTHVLTYANGCAQPLEQLRHGLAGYQDLQEGIAVLSEWLVGGLTHARFRTLAGRVLGADALVGGADFVETFRLLTGEAGLGDRAAFVVALRLYRGGGLTKDMVYLRGLRDLLAYLGPDADGGEGGPFWPLFVGKIALRHLPAVEALRARGVLRPAPLRPRYADDGPTLDRLARAGRGLSVLDVVRDAG